jgi:TRAP transporter TAXI family solute receptor
VAPIRILWLLVVSALCATGCTRGPDTAVLRTDVQARLDALFGRPVLVIEDLRRQGSAPYAGASGGARQVIVYFNATLQFAESYDPSDWQQLNPQLIATALGATDEGIVGLRAGRMTPGSQLRAHGSLVYRREGESWRAAEFAAPVATVAGVPPQARSRADELIQRLAQLVDTSPALDRQRRQQIVTEELDRALQTIQLRLDRTGERPVVAAGPAGGEYARFVKSLTARLEADRGIEVAHTEGSITNAFMIERGRARFGLVQSDVAAAAVTGEGVFAMVGPMGNLRAVASLFPEPLHVVVRSDAGIDSIAGLAGKRVAPGMTGSGTRFTALATLAAHGLGPGTFVEAEATGPGEALAALADGQLDALLVVTSAPWDELLQRGPESGLKVLALDPAAVARVAAEQHGAVPMEIPARTYPNQGEAIATVGATALLVAARDTPAEVVTGVLEMLFGAGASAAHGVSAARLSREQASVGITLPLHDAAARYFEAGRAQ